MPTCIMHMCTVGLQSTVGGVFLCTKRIDRRILRDTVAVATVLIIKKSYDGGPMAIDSINFGDRDSGESGEKQRWGRGESKRDDERRWQRQGFILL